MTGKDATVVVIGPNGRGHGSSRVVQSWTSMLRTAGHRTELIAAPLADPGEALEVAEGVTLHPVRVPEGLAGRARLSAVNAGAATLAAEIAADQPVDMFMTHSPLATIALRRVLPACKVAATWHSPQVDEYRLNAWTHAPNRDRWKYPMRRMALTAIERRALAATDLLHTLSAFTRGRLQGRYGRLARDLPWLRVRGTFDESLFVPASDRAAVRARLDLPADRRVLLAVRPLVPRNAPLRIVDAATAARDEGLDALFLIGGRGALESRLREEIERRQLTNRVRLLGFVKEEELPLYYQAADATMMPTRDLECFGLPAVESLACGTPCLASPTAAIPEVLAPFPDLLAARNDSVSFAQLVVEFLRQDWQTDRAQLAAYARREFSEQAVIKDATRLVEQAASLPNRS